jgi:hypothetical protein
MRFLATEKPQEVAIGGLQAPAAALVIDGPVHGSADAPGSTGNFSAIVFWIKTTY